MTGTVTGLPTHAGDMGDTKASREKKARDDRRRAEIRAMEADIEYVREVIERRRNRDDTADVDDGE